MCRFLHHFGPKFISHLSRITLVITSSGSSKNQENDHKCQFLHIFFKYIHTRLRKKQ